MAVQEGKARAHRILAMGVPHVQAALSALAFQMLNPLSRTQHRLNFACSDKTDRDSNKQNYTNLLRVHLRSESTPRQIDRLA